MTIIYVAHPFSADPEGNMKKIDAIMKELTIKYPDKCFISPLHNFSYAKDAREIDILPKCFELLSKCTELWVFGDYAKSPGCCAEIAFVRYLNLNIPVLFRKEE